CLRSQLLCISHCSAPTCTLHSVPTRRSSDLLLSCALERNAEDTLCERDMLWIARGHKMKERMNGREPHVSRGHAILALLFQVGQEGQDSGRIKISQIEPCNRLLLLLGKKPQQQNNAVAVAVDGVRTGSPKTGKVIREVVADCSAESIRK